MASRSPPQAAPLRPSSPPEIRERLGWVAPPAASALVLLGGLGLPLLVLIGWMGAAVEGSLRAVMGLLAASLAIGGLALTLSLPLALWGALYLTELARPVTRARLLPLLGLAVRLPAVLYAWLGLAFIAPPLARLAPDEPLSLALGAALTLSLMLLPALTLGFAEVIGRVSPRVREAAYALGAGPLSTAFRVILPSVRAPLLARISRAGARASGEGVVVALLLGIAGAPGPIRTLSSQLLSPEGGVGPMLWNLAAALLGVSTLFAIAEGLLTRRGVAA